MLSNASKGEKKKFYTAVENLTSQKGNTEEQYKVLYKTLTKGKPIGTSEWQQASDMYHTLAYPIGVQNGMNNLRKSLPQILDTSTQSIAESITLSPETITRISKEALKDAAKQTLNDSLTMTKRIIMYPANKAMSYTIPKASREQFSELLKLPKEKFGQTYYNHLLDSKGLSGRAPAQVTITNRSAKLTVDQLITGQKNIMGGFSPLNNTIEYTKEFATASRAIQANLVAHELKHFEQADAVIRTFGIERYIQAQKNNLLHALKEKYKGTKTEAELLKMVEETAQKDKIEETIRKAFAESAKAPRISPASAEGQRAAKYLEGFEKYTGVKNSGFFLEMSNSYLKNPLEVEAYATGNKVKRQIGILENLNLETI